MKRYIAILVVLGISLQELAKVLLYINYEVNKDAIAANLCVNKKQKQNLCYGSCYLKKQLDKTNNNDDGATTLLVYKYEVEGVKECTFRFDVTCRNLLLMKNFGYDQSLLLGFPANVDPPPPRTV